MARCLVLLLYELHRRKAEKQQEERSLIEFTGALHRCNNMATDTVFRHNSLNDTPNDLALSHEPFGILSPYSPL